MANAPPLRQARVSAKQLLVMLYQRISQDRVLVISGGVTFYALLAVFPAIAALISVYGLFADLRSIHADLSSLGTFLPGGALSVISEQIKRVASNKQNTLGLAVLIGIAFSLWSANAGVKSMFDALNIVLRVDEKRGFIRLNLISLAFTLGGLIIVLLTIAFVLETSLLLNRLGVSGNIGWLIDIGRWPLMLAAGALGLAFLYRFGPSRDRIGWRFFSWGNWLAAFVGLLASTGFSWYAANFGTYNKTYGSLGAAVGFMTWIWISAIIVLVGEELNVILESLRHPHRHKHKPHPLAPVRDS